MMDSLPNLQVPAEVLVGRLRGAHDSLASVDPEYSEMFVDIERSSRRLDCNKEFVLRMQSR